MNKVLSPVVFPEPDNSFVFAFMKRIRNILVYPFHFLLTGVYFIFHRNLLFAGIPDTSYLLIAWAIVFLFSVLLFFLIKYFFKSADQRLAFTTLLMVIILFFGEVKDVFSQAGYLSFLSRYRYLLPVCITVAAVAAFHLKKNPFAKRWHLFFNLLILLFFLADLRLAFTDKYGEKLFEKNTLYSAQVEKNTSRVLHPDIYYIVTDYYPRSDFQQNVLEMKGGILDSLLERKGFRILRRSVSNYNYTPFSMAAVFGMNYVSGVECFSQPSPALYSRTLRMIQTSPFLAMLKKKNYTIINYSIFTLGDRAALMKEKFLTAGQLHVIFYQTLFYSLFKDIFWPLMVDKQNRVAFENKLRKKHLISYRHYNRRVTDSLFSFLSEEKTDTPVFLYAHLLMPHYPYFLDSAGKKRSDEEALKEPYIKNKTRFAGYIYYTNSLLDSITSKILQKKQRNSVIIIQSDHGSFDFTENTEDAFKNISAFYFPDRNYGLLYDSMSNVNTFRVVSNMYFGTEFPLLKDQTCFLK
ncbi:MAG: sulfatase-like hydrolase/transferase [Chitinophagaceae bacterium]|nr:sulfatase-like hydrolase/transferase [Chitinophagaceae bacterium]